MTIGILTQWLQRAHPEVRGGIIALAIQDLIYAGNGNYELGMVQPFRQFTDTPWIEQHVPFNRDDISSYGTYSALFAWRADIQWRRGALAEAESDALDALSLAAGHRMSVVLPLAFPGLVAGSIFTFALTLGDYITPTLVGGASSQFIGNVVYANVGIANNVPFAAAYATVPLLVMALYLVVAKRLGAFEAL